LWSCPLLRTGRLELIPATYELLASDRGDRTLLGRLLEAVVPLSWPPPLLDKETLEDFVQIQSEGSDQNFYSWYWIRSGDGQCDRILIGSGGTGSVPAEHDAVMIGYSVLEEFWNQGYATEAVSHLIPVILKRPGIRRIIATTYPEMTASIRVLEKNGFVPDGIVAGGKGMEEGTVRYVRIGP
jgi:RimJ/RimL family protein N-acetyltransferase